MRDHITYLKQSIHNARIIHQSSIVQRCAAPARFLKIIFSFDFKCNSTVECSNFPSQGKQCIASILIQLDSVQDRIVNQKMYKN